MGHYKRIQSLREEHGKTETELAQFLGVSLKLYQRYEQGLSKFGASKVILLAEYYDVSIDYLLYLSDRRDPYPRRQPYPPSTLS